MGTLGEHASVRQAALRNLSELEETPEAPENQDILTYIKNLATYVSDLASTFLGFAHDTKASALVLGEYLERIHIQTEAYHGSLGQYEYMEREHRTV